MYIPGLILVREGRFDESLWPHLEVTRIVESDTVVSFGEGWEGECELRAQLLQPRVAALVHPAVCNPLTQPQDRDWRRVHGEVLSVQDQLSRSLGEGYVDLYASCTIKQIYYDSLVNVLKTYCMYNVAHGKLTV